MGATLDEFEIPDIVAEVRFLTSQIPKGMISTYSAIADALGDFRATRAVAEIVKEIGVVPDSGTHRVVTVDGIVRLRGTANCTKALRREGIQVTRGRIFCPEGCLDDLLFTDFNTTRPLRSLRERQLMLARKLNLEPIRRIMRIAGIDIAYRGRRAFGAATVYDFNACRYLGTIYAEANISFPYIPTYLFYREFPIIELLTRQLNRGQERGKGCVLLIDGNGILHPFGLGIASQVGVELGMPTVGVAKSLLCGEVRKVPTSGIGYNAIFLNGRKTGYCVRPARGRRPVYISPGHKVSVRQALEINIKLYRKAEIHPLRKAHILARERVITCCS